MKCQNCNSDLVEGAKFCTTCGTPAAVANACPACGAALRPDAKFCTACGQTIASANAPAVQPPAVEPQGGSIDTVKQKIFWNIQKGEVACRLNESEFINYDSAQGLIVNDGTTAYVKANGKVVAEIHGGIYDFVDPKELDKLLQSRTGGAVSALSGMGRLVVNALLGRRVKDRVSDKKDDPKRQRSLDAVVESLKRHEAFALQLKLDRSFSLVFGPGTAEQGAEFTPMRVRTKLLDMQIGVRAIFRITDFTRFAENFLADERVATTYSLAAKLQPAIQNAAQAVMQDREFDSTSIPADVVEAIMAKIVASSDQFYGLTLERIAEVVASNEDLERMRSLSRELYLSEKELDYLRRTGDFRNRLSAETNSQTISAARNELQLHQGLQEVNKDHLLTEDELDKFYTVLSREKRIRDAKSEEEIEAALADIEKTGLLREEDIDTMRVDIAERRYQRGQAIKLMQLKDEVEFERVRTAGEGQIAIETLRQGLEMQELHLTARRKEDDYSDERREKDRAHARADRQAEQELDNAEMDAQLERLRKLEQINSVGEQREMDHQREMERLRHEGIAQHAALSAEQIMAMGAAGGNLDSEAAARFADSFSAGRNADQIQQNADARVADSQRHEDHMMQMMREMREMATTMTGHIVQHKDDQKNEYRERAERQEARTDKAQDSALEYTTRNNQQAQHPQQPAQPQAGQTSGKTCPDCGVAVAPGVRFCPNCGRDIK